MLVRKMIQTHTLICGSGLLLHMKDNARVSKCAEEAGSRAGMSGGLVMVLH